MRQPDSQEAPPKNQNREINSDGELTRHELELELTRDELTEELELTGDELTEELELTRDELTEELELTRDELTEELELTRDELTEELSDSRRLSLLYPGTSTAPENDRARANQETTRQSLPPSSPRFGF